VGKRIDDLRKLDDTPIERRVEAPESADVRDTEWYSFVGLIDDLQASGNFDWAVETLNGIRETVLHRRQVTEAQKRAVNNIEHARDGHYRSRRRYEGWDPRGR